MYRVDIKLYILTRLLCLAYKARIMC